MASAVASLPQQCCCCCCLSLWNPGICSRTCRAIDLRLNLQRACIASDHILLYNVLYAAALKL